MPVRQQDVARAAGLLERYREQLAEPQQLALSADTERLLVVLRSRLLHALIDIQEFYELTVQDEWEVVQRRTRGTARLAHSWDPGLSPVTRAHAAVQRSAAGSDAATSSAACLREFPALNASDGPPCTVLDGIATKEPSPCKDADWREEPVTTALLSAPDQEDAVDDDWEYQRVTLNRGSHGLGFSIAGGHDAPHIGTDPSIFVTKLIPGGVATADGRLRAGDVIAGVNGVSVKGSTHEQAVEVLKRAGSTVQLLTRRRRPPAPDTLVTVELRRGAGGLGFSIAGGVGNQHIPGDNGIYITKMLEGGACQLNGRLAAGDRLVAVDAGRGQQQLLNVSHEEAVAALKSSAERVILTVAKPAGARPPAAPEPAPTLPPPLPPPPPPSLLPAASATWYRPAPPVVARQEMEVSSVLQRRSRDDDTVCNSGMADSPDLLPPLAVCANDVTREPRTVTLVRSWDRGLGFNIVGGEECAAIYVSHLHAGGPAEQSGQVHRGDQILAVNGAPLGLATHEHAAAALKGAGQTVSLHVQYRPEEYNRFEAKIHQLKQQAMSGSGTLRTTHKRSLYVRTLFDYDPRVDDDLPSRGLPFAFGDILHVTNASDDQWWQAKRLTPQGAAQAVGIIPSRQRWERKQQARGRSVGFRGRPTNLSTLDRKKRNYAFSRKFPFMKSKEDVNVKSDDSCENDPALLSPRIATSGAPSRGRRRTPSEPVPLSMGDGPVPSRGMRRAGSVGSLLRLLPELPLRLLARRRTRSASSIRSTLADSVTSVSEGDDRSLQDETVLSYLPVQHVEVSYCRPVILLGELKDRINEDLISQYPEDFGSCVPHTTRARREGEEDHRDYHFVTSREQMERDIQSHLFIEAGQFNDNLYGTSLASVRHVAEEQRKHCILDVSGSAIRRLHVARLYPIAVFIRARSLEHVMAWNKRLTEEQAKAAFEKNQKIETDFAEYFTAIVVGETPEEVYDLVKDVIREQGTNRIWIPSDEKL